MARLRTSLRSTRTHPSNPTIHVPPKTYRRHQSLEVGENDITSHPTHRHTGLHPWYMSMRLTVATL
ncbi:hypothetical protein SCLCIDRAFT_1217371 [Scleroderma citrinum Foug A]|uniref:Uncharacterized protein n=1 Tax=Scleroderma citrinum Foug A TaxID=1036808 RepID=A0A0C3DVC4_9AGAM|nr:hypothetical protein SCLCIDRAFT_1217371 [Scleroderma citrinum Foug A]